jgi:hypothetical protein
MTFDQEMNRFFRAYSSQQRASAEAHVEYQKAAREQNAVRASEIAAKIFEGEVGDIREFKLVRKYR